MLRINPFAALRPRPEYINRVASLPFDVFSTEEARNEAKGNDLTFLRVDRSEIDFPPGTNPHSDEVYDRARENLKSLQDKAVLIREDKPCIYIYRLSVVLLGKPVEQTGIVSCCHIEDYSKGIIKKHENTRKDKVEDRTHHILSVNANAGMVFLLYKGQERISRLIDEEVKKQPLYDFVSADGVHHTVWRVENHRAYVEAFSRLDAAYIADGHHRSDSAANAGLKRREANPNHKGNEEYNWFLTGLFQAEQLSILPYHRVVKNLNGLTPDRLLNQLRGIATVQENARPEPEKAGSFGMYLDKKWYRIVLTDSAKVSCDPVNSLDYVLLYDRILNPILKIGDIRTDERIDFVGGIRGTAELEKRVNSGECTVAFAMRPATINDLLSVADAGMIMPPKSTWFEPKLRSGLLIHTLD